MGNSVYFWLFSFLGIFVLVPWIVQKFISSALIKENLSKYFVHLVLILGSITMLLPFIWMLSTSFKSSVEASKMPPVWIPNAIKNFSYNHFGKDPTKFKIGDKNYKINSLNTFKTGQNCLFTKNYTYCRDIRNNKKFIGNGLWLSNKGVVKQIYRLGSEKKLYDIENGFYLIPGSIKMLDGLKIGSKIHITHKYLTSKITHIFKIILCIVLFCAFIYGSAYLFNLFWDDIEKKYTVYFYMNLLFGICKYFVLFSLFLLLLKALYYSFGADDVDNLFKNYSIAWRKEMFGRYFFNSFIIAAVTTVGQIFAGALAAYAFAFMNFPFKNAIFLMFLGTMMVPQQVLLIPNFLMLGKLGWIDRYPSLIIPWLASVFGIFLLRQFFMSIPKDLYEAAKIDGCSKFKFFTAILLPISGAPITTIGIFTFLGSWNSFLWPLIVTNSKELRTIQVGLQAFSSAEGTKWGLLMAASTFSILPLVIGYFIAQKQFIQGIAKSGLKE